MLSLVGTAWLFTNTAGCRVSRALWGFVAGESESMGEAERIVVVQGRYITYLSCHLIEVRHFQTDTGRSNRCIHKERVICDGGQKRLGVVTYGICQTLCV